ncbi:MAG: hypothetical protein V7711_12475 [Pseudomonadales bacterium]
MNFAKIGLCWLLMALSACTTTKTLETHLNGAEIHKQLVRGDHLVVHEYSGRVSDIKLEGISDNALYGHSSFPPFSSITINIDAISKIDNNDTHSMATSLGIIGALTVIIPTAFVAGAVGFEWE